MKTLILKDFEIYSNKNLSNQVLRKHVKLHNSQNVNQNLIIPTIMALFWCQLVLIIMISRLRDLKHRYLAGAFSLASILDNTVVLLRLSYDLDDEKYSLG